MRKKILILCADDFGLSPGINNGILELLTKRRLSAVSCMAINNNLRDYKEELLSHSVYADIGLHLVLTSLPRLGPNTSIAQNGQFGNLNGLVKKSLTLRLSRTDLATEIKCQINRFFDVFNKPPDFIDGHHHVHQLPVIRDVLLDVISEGGYEKVPYLRVTHDRLLNILCRNVAVTRACFIGSLGAAFKRRAVRKGFEVNNGFSGIYDFSDVIPYADLFKKFITGIKSGAMVMCHPGYNDEELRRVDILTQQRKNELDFFSGPLFLGLLEDQNIELGRFSKT